MAKGRDRLIRGTMALLFCAFAMGHVYAGADQYGPQLPTDRPAPLISPEARFPGDAKTAPARKTERRRGRYAAPVEMEKLPAPAVDAGRPVLPAPPTSPRPPAPSPAPVTSCDPGGCWDSGGQRYNGSGAVMIHGNGRVCQQVGSMMQCN